VEGLPPLYLTSGYGPAMSHVSWSVCVLGTRVDVAEMAEPIMSWFAICKPGVKLGIVGKEYFGFG